MDALITRTRSHVMRKVTVTLHRCMRLMVPSLRASVAGWAAVLLLAVGSTAVAAPCGECGSGATQDAAFVSQSVPQSLAPGQAVAVSVKMTNTGTGKWTSANNFRLGSQDPADNTVWGLGRVALPTTVSAGQSVTFNFTIKAPATAGTYTFRWRMVQDGVAWFGASTPSTSIVVGSPNTPPTVRITSPTNGLSASAPATVVITAEAADTGGSIASVSFVSNGVQVGSDASAPFGLTLSSLPAGSYQFKAIATDNGGLTTTSEAVTVTVAPSTAVSATRQYVYDEYERLCKTINPESGATIVDYDAAGNVLWTAEGTALTSAASCDRGSVAEAQKVQRRYDALNRVTGTTTPGGVADLEQTYRDDGLVKSVSVQNPGGFKVTTTYEYNKRGLLTGESSANGSTLFGLSYAYDTNGNLSALTYPDNEVVSFTPDAMGRARRIIDTGGVVYADQITYAAHGALRSFRYGNGIVHTTDSNTRLLPTRSRDAYVGESGSKVVLDDEYLFDANGNVKDITDRAQNGLTTRGMEYDALDRLTAAVSPQQWGAAVFGYDALDNLRIADQGARQYRYNYDATNRLANIKNPAGTTLITLAYDARGNTTGKNNQAFVFDAVNRMSQVTGQQGYRYDGLGRRVQTTDADGKTTFWIYSQSGQVLYTSEARRSQNLAYIYLGNTQVATRAVAWGSGTATVRYQHTDALGSPVAETDALRNIVKRNSYTPYGETFGNTVIDGTGYTGHVMDRATGLTYMQQRYYDPLIGRFVSTDPVSPLSDPLIQFNRYRYANSNPFRFTDPDGRYAKLIRPLIKVLKKGGDVRGALKESKTEIVDSCVTILDSTSSPVDKAVAVFDLLSPVSGKELSKANRLLRNELQGAIGEADKAKSLGGRLAGRQVTIETTAGTRTRVDFVTTDRGVVEVKTGGATQSRGQRDLQADIASGRAVTPRGENARAAGLEPGVPTIVKKEE